MIIKIDGEHYEVFDAVVKLLEFYDEEDRDKYFEALDNIKKHKKPIKILQFSTQKNETIKG